MDFITITAGLLDGFKFNLIIFGITLLAALPLGLILSFGSMSKITPIRWLVKSFIWIIRGTPLMLQIMLVFFGPGLLWGGRWFLKTQLGTYSVRYKLCGIFF